MSYALEVKNLKKVYATGIEALKGVDLAVEEGDFFALLGPNGAGKTTLIGVVTGLVTKTSGEAFIYGKSIDGDAQAAKMRVGVVPQEFNFSIFEKVIDIICWQAGYFGIPRAEAERRAEKYLKQLGLWEKRNDKAQALSGGMKRRLMIVRALLHEPQLLILDEPTAGVDIELRRGMWEFLTGLNKSGVTIILTTHYLEEAEQLCRNMAIIDKGNIVKKGKVKELLSNMDEEVFVFDVSRELAPADIKKLADFMVHKVDEHTIELTITKTHNLNKAMVLLNDLGIAVESLRNKHNRLEELFLGLTRK
jgi:ABC-2 type transport system ATP-binding protein